MNKAGQSQVEFRDLTLSMSEGGVEHFCGGHEVF